MNLQVLTAVEAANQQQKHVLGNKVKTRFGADLRGRHFAIWGLAFKANTDDMREASSLTVIRDLLEAGASVAAYDPVASTQAQRQLPASSSIRYCASQADALTDADALVIVTEWKEFRSPDFEHIKSTLKQATIFDGRNLYEPQRMRELGFEYHAIGR